jgi:medium-chain acyl-[acyl-carrier-protein] hydrolase
MGVPYLVPVNPIIRYQPSLDEQMVPVAEAPPQEIGPWRHALERLTSDRPHYAELARASRAAALDYVNELSVEPFEDLLRRTPVVQVHNPPRKAVDDLSPDKRRLLAIRLRQRAPAAAWFPGIDRATGPRLFCFPHAGGGTSSTLSRAREGAELRIVPVRLPGRESRFSEAPFDRIEPLIAALAPAMERCLDRPFAFFGHSMGAIVAFELARELRRRGQPQPRMLIASGARAPRFRLHHVAPPDADDEELLSDLRRLSGTPDKLLGDEAALAAVLPALRADARLYRHYVYRPEQRLDCPIRAYGGEDDADITTAHLEAWAGETTAPFAFRRFRGGHFYLHTCHDEVLAALTEDLRPVW